MMTDHVRRKWRWGAIAVLVPLTIVALVFAGKFISANALAGSEVTAHERRSYAEAQQHAEGLQVWNFFETWKAPYNLAVPLGMLGEHERAIDLFDEALRLHPEEGSSSYCVVYTNRVYVVEKQGDAAREADDRDSANRLYRQALSLIEAAPAGCMEEPAEHEPDIKEQLTASVPRIEEKIDDDSGESEGESEEPDGGGGEESEPQTPQEQLEEQNQQAQQQQQQQEAQQGEEGGAGGGSDVERPW